MLGITQWCGYLVGKSLLDVPQGELVEHIHISLYMLQWALRYLMESYGIKWNCMETCSTCFSFYHHGILLTLWNHMAFYRIIFCFVLSYGVLWNPMESYGILFLFSVFCWGVRSHPLCRNLHYEGTHAAMRVQFLRGTFVMKERTQPRRSNSLREP